MFGGEDDDGDADVSAVPYACMPSLVSLQQMRNRLHLAYTGKKLMKWTALATGRELRKLAKEIQDSYKSFRQDMRQGYILLARVRYSNPYFNQMVLENVGHKANIKVKATSKSISGVKTLEINIMDDEYDNYIHLGIGRGGETVFEAKEFWRELLKKVILMCQQRITFMTLEIAHRNATRRKNALQRVVIPRTLATMQYICTELDELERENFYRIKKILANKYKNKAKDNDECKHVVEDSNCQSCEKKKLKGQKEMNTEIKKIECIVCGLSAEKSVVDETDKGVYGDIIIDIDRIKAEALELISSDMTLNLMCDHCIGKLKDEQVTPKATDKAVNEIPDKESIITIKSMKSAKPSQSIEDLELGTFEIEIEEITKIVRTKNEDGTVTEQKKIIRRKKERRAPLFDARSESLDRQSSTTAKKSKKIVDAKTIGIVTLSTPIMWRNIRKAQSLTLSSPKPMVDHIGKLCQSLCSFLSSININFFSNDSKNTMSEKTPTFFLMSNSESEELLLLHDIQDYQTLKSQNSIEDGPLTDSNNIIIQSRSLNENVTIKINKITCSSSYETKKH